MVVGIRDNRRFIDSRSPALDSLRRVTRNALEVDFLKELTKIENSESWSNYEEKGRCDTLHKGHRNRVFTPR